MSVGINQCGQTDDFLLLGQLIGEAGARSTGRSCCSRPAGCRTGSSRSASCAAESSDPMKNIITPEAREADLHVLDLLQRATTPGDRLIPEYRKVGPRGSSGTT